MWIGALALIRGTYFACDHLRGYYAKNAQEDGCTAKCLEPQVRMTGA